MPTKSLHVSVPELLFNEIEKRRKTPAGEISRSSYVTGLIKRGLLDEDTS